MKFASGVLIRSVFIKQEEDRVTSGPGFFNQKNQFDTKLNSLKKQ